MKTIKVTLPAYMASALINGDVSGLDDRDLPYLEMALGIAAREGGYFVGCGDEPSFQHRVWDLPGHLGCDVLEYEILCEGEES